MLHGELVEQHERSLHADKILQHYGHPPDGCDKDEAALRIQSKFWMMVLLLSVAGK